MELFWILILAGIAVSVVSAMESRVQWIASFCAFFGEGCRKTEDFTLFAIPISWWGIGYYVALALVMHWVHPLVFWFVMAGLGFELTFLWIMVSIRAFCIFCLLNALVVVGLVWLYFDPLRIWPAATLVLLFFIVSNALVSRENMSRLSPETKKQPGDEVARVEGETVTKEELERPLSQSIYQLQEKIYRLKRDRLDRLIQDILLQKEADRRGVSKKRLVETVLNGQPEVSQAEVDRYCEQNRRQMETWEGSQADFKEQVRQKLARKKKAKILARFTDDLKDRYEVATFLEKPALPLTKVDIEGRPALGPGDAEVVVVEFSDPFCPACRQAHDTTAEVKAAYDGQIRWVFKDFPLKTHKGAKLAAEAAHCAEEQGRFWEYQDMLFEADGKPGPDELKDFADALDLDREKFDRCLDRHEYRSQVEEDVRSARAAGIAATPTFIVNGKMISGAQSFDEFKRAIDSELDKAESAAAANSHKG